MASVEPHGLEHNGYRWLVLLAWDIHPISTSNHTRLSCSVLYGASERHGVGGFGRYRAAAGSRRVELKLAMYSGTV